MLFHSYGGFELYEKIQNGKMLAFKFFKFRDRIRALYPLIALYCRQSWTFQCLYTCINLPPFINDVHKFVLRWNRTQCPHRWLHPSLRNERTLLVMNESNTKLNLLTKPKLCLKNALTLPRKRQLSTFLMSNCLSGSVVIITLQDIMSCHIKHNSFA
jgi:hypothetical protein